MESVEDEEIFLLVRMSQRYEKKEWINGLLREESMLERISF